MCIYIYIYVYMSTTTTTEKALKLALSPVGTEPVAEQKPEDVSGNPRDTENSQFPFCILEFLEVPQFPELEFLRGKGYSPWSF